MNPKWVVLIIVTTTVKWLIRITKINDESLSVWMYWTEIKSSSNEDFYIIYLKELTLF